MRIKGTNTCKMLRPVTGTCQVLCQCLLKQTNKQKNSNRVKAKCLTKMHKRWEGEVGSVISCMILTYEAA